MSRRMIGMTVNWDREMERRRKRKVSDEQVVPRKNMSDKQLDKLIQKIKLKD